MNAIRHEIKHYEQHIEGTRKFTEEHDKEAMLTARLWADSVLNQSSDEDINPIRKKGRNNPNSLYESFHGTPAKRVTKHNYNPPQEGEKLLAIGKLVEIVYKPFGSSGRKGTLYSHRVGDTGDAMLPSNSILATDQEGKELYIIKEKAGKHPFFSERGIIG